MRTGRARIHQGFLVIAILAAPSLAAQQLVPDEQLIGWLADSNLSVRSAAVNHLLKIEGEPGTRVMSSVVLEFERTRTEVAKREQLVKAGTVTSDDEALSERIYVHLGNLIQLLSRSWDSQVIHPLAAVLHTGRMATRGLATFGSRAVDPALAVSTGDTEDTHAIAGALRVLQFVVEEARFSPLPANARNRIRAEARRRLSGRQHVVVAMAACDLAIATGDPGLRSRVATLANNPTAAADLGIIDQASRSQIQRAATAALARKH